MKLMKKLSALVLALVLVLSVAAFAAAEDVTGTYAASTVEYEGMKLDASMFFTTFEITLNADGSAVFNTEGELANDKWTMDGNTITFPLSQLTAEYDNGTLVMDSDGVIFLFTKADAAAESPVASAAAIVAAAAEKNAGENPAAAETVTLPAFLADAGAREVTITAHLADEAKDLLGEDFEMYQELASSSHISLSVASAGKNPVFFLRFNLAGNDYVSAVITVKDGAIYIYNALSKTAYAADIMGTSAVNTSSLKSLAADPFVPDVSKLSEELSPLLMVLFTSADASVGSGEKTITVDGAEKTVTEYYLNIGPQAGASLLGGLASALTEGTELFKTVEAYGSVFGLTPATLRAAFTEMAEDVSSLDGALKLSACMDGAMPVLASVQCGDWSADLTVSLTETGLKAVIALSNGNSLVFTYDGTEYRLAAAEPEATVFEAYFAPGVTLKAGFSADTLKADFVRNNDAVETGLLTVTESGETMLTFNYTKAASSFNSVFNMPANDITSTLNGSKTAGILTGSFTLTADGQSLIANLTSGNGNGHFDLTVPEGIANMNVDTKAEDGTRTGTLLFTSEAVEGGMTLTEGWTVSEEQTKMGFVPGVFNAELAAEGVTVKDKMTVSENEAGATVIDLAITDLLGMSLGGSGITVTVAEGAAIEVPAMTATLVTVDELAGVLTSLFQF